MASTSKQWLGAIVAEKDISNHISSIVLLHGSIDRLTPYCLRRGAENARDREYITSKLWILE
jgi:hypothetical protein